MNTNEIKTTKCFRCGKEFEYCPADYLGGYPQNCNDCFGKPKTITPVEQFKKDTATIENFGAPKTADDLDFDKLTVVYFVNKDTRKVESFTKKDLFVFIDTVGKTSGARFDLENESLNVSDFYGSQSAATDALIGFVKDSIRGSKDQIGMLEKLIKQDKEILGKLEQGTAPYIPQNLSNGKKIRCGNISF